MDFLTFGHRDTDALRFENLPFKLIVATAWVANLNVDLFIRGHNKEAGAVMVPASFRLDLVNQQSILLQSPVFPIYSSFVSYHQDLFHHLP